MHYSKKKQSSSVGGGTVAAGAPSNAVHAVGANFGIIAKSHPAFNATSGARNNNSSSGTATAPPPPAAAAAMARKDESAKQQQQQQQETFTGKGGTAASASASASVSTPGGQNNESSCLLSPTAGGGGGGGGGSGGFELVSLRSPKPPPASEQQQQQQHSHTNHQRQSAVALANAAAPSTARTSSTSAGGNPLVVSGGSGAAAAAAGATAATAPYSARCISSASTIPAATRTDSLHLAIDASAASERRDDEEPGTNRSHNGEEEKNSRALVATPKATSVTVISSPPQKRPTTQDALLSPTPAAPKRNANRKLSDGRLPLVGGTFISNNRNQQQQQQQQQPPSTATSSSSARKQEHQRLLSFSSLPPISLAKSQTIMQQMTGTAASDPFVDLSAGGGLIASPRKGGNNNINNNKNSGNDLGATLTLFAAAAPSGPLSSKSASQRHPKHWTDMLPSMADLEQSAGMLIAQHEITNGTSSSSSHHQHLHQRAATAATVVNPATASSLQGHHNVPPLAAELLRFIRKELQMIYAPFFDKKASSSSSSSSVALSNTIPSQQQQQQQQQQQREDTLFLQQQQQLVHSPDIKLARWRVFLDAFRNLAGHFREFGPFMNILLREIEDMYYALQQHGRDRALFAMVANQAEGVAAELARETTRSVFDELHLTKKRNQSMLQSLQEMDGEIMALRGRLTATSDEKVKVGCELDTMTARCKTLVDALQGEANRQNAAFAEAKAIREENERLRANIRSLEEQRKNDSLLQEELFSKLDQLSLAISEGGVDYSKVMMQTHSPTTAHLKPPGRGGGGGGGGGGDDEDEFLSSAQMSSPYAQQENIHSLEGMRRWGSTLHLSLMRAKEDTERKHQQQSLGSSLVGGGNSGMNNNNTNNTDVDDDDGDFMFASRRRADKRLSTVMESLIGPEDTMTGAGFSARPAQSKHAVVAEAKRDRDALVREKMLRESMKFAASCSGDTAAEKLQEALLRCFAKVRKYRNSVGVLRQTIDRLEKKVQKMGASSMQQAIRFHQQQQQQQFMRSNSAHDALASGPAAHALAQQQAVGGGGGGSVNIAWSVNFPSSTRRDSVLLEASFNNNNNNNSGGLPRSLGAQGRTNSSGALLLGPSHSTLMMMNQQQQQQQLQHSSNHHHPHHHHTISNLRQLSDVTNSDFLARFETERPLTPRPNWSKLSSIVPAFSPRPDPDSGLLPSSDELLEELADRLRNQQSEKLKEVERKILSSRVSGWVDEENSNSKTHHVKSAKASDITSLLMASSRSFVGLGSGPEVPVYLRYSGRLRNKVLGKGDCEVLLKRFWKARRESVVPGMGAAPAAAGAAAASSAGADDDTVSNSSYAATSAAASMRGATHGGGGGGGGGAGSDLAADLALGVNSSFRGGGAGSPLTAGALHGVHDASFAVSIDDFYQQWLQQQTGNPKAAIELAYSILDVCERYQHDPDCGMFLKIMRGVVSEHCLAHEIYVVEQLRKVLGDLDTYNTGQLPRSIVHRVLKQLFPSKRYGEALRLRFALIPFTAEDDEGHAFVRYADLFEEDSEGNQTTFIERLRHQHFDEALEVLVEIETSVRETQQTTGARRTEMPLWQIAHSIRNIDSRMPGSAINHILAVGAACAPAVVQDALDRMAGDAKVDIEAFFKRVRRGVYVRRYSPPPEDDVDLLQDEADDADVEDAEEGHDAEHDAERLKGLIREAEETEECVVNGGGISSGQDTPQTENLRLPAPPPRNTAAATTSSSLAASYRHQQQPLHFDGIGDGEGAFTETPPETPGGANRDSRESDRQQHQQQRQQSVRGTNNRTNNNNNNNNNNYLTTPTATTAGGGGSIGTRRRSVVSILSPREEDGTMFDNISFAQNADELLTL